MMIEAIVVIAFIILWLGLSTIKFTNKTQKELQKNQFEKVIK